MDRAQKAHGRNRTEAPGKLDRHIFARLSHDARLMQHGGKIALRRKRLARVLGQRRLDLENLAIHRVEQIERIETGKHRAQIERAGRTRLRGGGEQREIRTNHEMLVGKPASGRSVRGRRALYLLYAKTLVFPGILAQIRAHLGRRPVMGVDDERAALAFGPFKKACLKAGVTGGRSRKRAVGRKQAPVSIHIRQDSRPRHRPRVELGQIARPAFGKRHAAAQQPEKPSAECVRNAIEQFPLRRHIQFERKISHRTPRNRSSASLSTPIIRHAKRSGRTRWRDPASEASFSAAARAARPSARSCRRRYRPAPPRARIRAGSASRIRPLRMSAAEPTRKSESRATHYP